MRTARATYGRSTRGRYVTSRDGDVLLRVKWGAEGSVVDLTMPDDGNARLIIEAIDRILGASALSSIIGGNA